MNRVQSARRSKGAPREGSRRGELLVECVRQIVLARLAGIQSRNARPFALGQANPKIQAQRIRDFIAPVATQSPPRETPHHLIG